MCLLFVTESDPFDIGEVEGELLCRSVGSARAERERRRERAYILPNQSIRSDPRFPTLMPQLVIIMKVALGNLLDPARRPSSASRSWCLDSLSAVREISARLTNVSSHPTSSACSTGLPSTPPYWAFPWSAVPSLPAPWTSTAAGSYPFPRAAWPLLPLV